jgi:peptidoglycan LD-endopeptidase CwlK
VDVIHTAAVAASARGRTIVPALPALVYSSERGTIANPPSPINTSRQLRGASMSDRLFGDDVIFQQRFLKSAALYTGRIDGIWGPLTDGAYNAFLAQAEQISLELGRFDPRTERNLASLQLPAQRAARRFMVAVLAFSIDARIISGMRSYEEQNALFRRGRFGNPGPRVTNARRRQSRHNFGIAWNIGIFEGGTYVTTGQLALPSATAGIRRGRSRHFGHPTAPDAIV